MEIHMILKQHNKLIHYLTGTKLPEQISMRLVGFRLMPRAGKQIGGLHAQWTAKHSVAKYKALRSNAHL